MIPEGKEKTLDSIYQSVLSVPVTSKYLILPNPYHDPLKLVSQCSYNPQLPICNLGTGFLFKLSWHYQGLGLAA